MAFPLSPQVLYPSLDPLMFGLLTAEDLDHLEELNTRATEAKGGLRLYVEDLWRVVEPAQPFVSNWHIDAICDHLEAVTRGDLKDLIITIPPRHSKSLTVAVMWPTWEWGPAHKPHTRWLFSAYAQALSLRDSQKRRRLISSSYYQSRWGGVFYIGGEKYMTDGTAKYENNHTGYHMATSVKGSNTGEGGDRIVCLPGGELVQTENGPITIGRLVDTKWQGRVWALGWEGEGAVLTPVTGWHRNPGRPILRVETSHGAVRLTHDHRVLTARGWVEAQTLVPGDMLPDLILADTGNDSFVHAQGSGQLPARHVRRLDHHDDVGFGELDGFGHHVGGLAMALGDVAPGPTVADSLDLLGAHPVHDPKFTGRLAGLHNFHRLPGGESSIRPPVDAVAVGVGSVLGLSAVGQIGETVVGGVVVKMAGLLAGGTRPHERQQHSLMHGYSYPGPLECPTHPTLNNRVPGAFVQDPARPVITNSTEGADRVVGKQGQGDGSPNFGRRVLRVVADGGNHGPDVTYCISTAYHNFLAGDNIVVANCDDPINVKEVASEVVRQSVNDWWDIVMSTRRNNPHTSGRVVIMQRTHEEDLVGHILGRTDQSGSTPYTLLSLPTEYEGKLVISPISGGKSVDPRTEIGQLLNPVRFGPKDIAQAKIDLGIYGYSAQHQQSPSPAEGGMLRKQWWNFWAPLGHEAIGRPYYVDPALVRLPGFKGARVVGLPRGFDRQAQSWDMAFKKHSETDYVVGQRWGGINGRDGYAAAAFLLDQRRNRWTFTETVEEVVGAARAWPGAVIKYIEDTANGPAVIDSLKVSSDVSGIIPVNPEGSKDSRVSAVSPVVQAGNIFLPLPDLPGYGWVRDLIKEAATYPNATHDDQVDAITQIVIKWFNIQSITVQTMFGTTDL